MDFFIGKLTGSSRFCTSSHASRGRKNSNNGSADNRDVLPRVIIFNNCDAGSEAPFCMKSLKRKAEIVQHEREQNIFHQLNDKIVKHVIQCAQCWIFSTTYLSTRPASLER